MFYYVFNNCIFLHIHVLKWIHNTYSVREICTSKTILITTKLAGSLLRGATSSTTSEMVFKWKPRHLESNRPSRCYRNTPGHCCEANGIIFLDTCTSDWFCGKNSQPFMVNMTVYRAVFRVFPFKNFITGSSKMVTKSTNMIFSSSACKKTLLLSLWLAVFDSFLLKDSFNSHKT